MAGRTLTIDIKTADAQTLAALKRIQKELKDTGGVAERTSKQGLSLGSALGGLAIGAGISKSIGEFEEAETSARATAAAIEATGNAAGISAEEQAKLVDALSKTAALDDEVVNGAANMLRQFDQIKGAKFGETLAASADVAAAKNIELSASSQMLGKALQDPFTGYTKLQRVIGPFSDATKAQIAAFEKTNDVAGAQGVILAELEKRFGGQAEAAVTDSAKMKVAFDDAAESLGGALAPALSVAASGAQKASTAFQGLPQPLQQAVLIGGALAVVGPKVAEGWGEAADSARSAKAALNSSVSDFGAVKSGALAAAAGLASYTTAYGILEKASASRIDVEALGKDLQVIADGSKDLSPVFDQFGGSAESMAAKVKELNGAYDAGNVEKYGDAIVDAAKSTATFGLLSASETSNRVNQLKNEFGDLDAQLAAMSVDEARSAFGTLSVALTDQGVTAAELAAIFPKYRAEVERADRAAAAATGSTADYAAAIAGVNQVIADSYTEGVRANQAFAGYLQASLDVNAAVVDVADAQEKAAAAADAVTEAEQGVEDASRSAAQARRGVAEAEKGVEEARKGVEEATRKVADAERDQAQAAEDVTTAQADLTQAQADAQIGSEYMADALDGVTKAEEAVQLAQEDSLRAQQELDQARSDYSQTLSDLKDNAAGAADDVLSAEIRLRNAQQALAELGKDGKPVSADDRLTAEIAIREAERRLREARERAADAQEVYNRNQQAGVEGSDAVVAAQDAVSEAADRQSEAQGRLEGAVQNVSDTQATALERVGAAQDTLAEKIQARIDADQRVIDAKQDVIDAQDEVQRATQGVADAHDNVAKAADGAAAAQKRVTDAKQAVLDAQHEVERAIKDVREALDVQATSWVGVLGEIKVDGTLRQAIRGITGELKQLAGQYDVVLNIGGNAADAILSGVSNPFLDALAAAVTGKESPGKSTGPAERNSKMDNPHGPPVDKNGAAPAAAAAAAASGPETRPGGWVKQPNGRWWRPRKPGEANYGDGYVDADEMMRIRQAEEAARASEPRHTTTPNGGSTPQVVVHMSLADVSDPAATAEIINKRLGWELRRLIGSAA